MRLRLIVALLLAGAPPLASQQALPVSGRVLDASTGAGIAGAEVRLTGGDSARLVAGPDGRWRAVLRRGTYTLQVRAIGFRAATESRSVDGAPVVVQLAPLPLALDRVVVTAARREQRLADVVVTPELITAEDIARTGASDLASALGAHTGVALDGGTPAGAGAMLQGMGSERVLVLLDGQPLPGRIDGEFDLSRMPTSLVERVEIVKGPQSALYGTDAMGGVINIITRQPREDGGFVSASVIAGSRGRADGAIAAGGSRGRLATRAEAGRRFIETAPGRPDERGAMAQRLDGVAKARWRASDATTLDASVLALDERQRWMGGTLYQFADNVQLTANAGVEHVGEATRWRARLFASSYDHVSRASALPQPIRGDTGQRQVQRLGTAELGWSRELGAHLLDVGVQARRDDTRSVRIPGGRRAIVLVEPGAQLETTLSDATAVTTGVRVSASDRWGTHVTPRLAVRHRTGDGLTLRASAGTGFRAPDFRELYMRFQNQSVGYAVQGNEQLRPERSANVMLGTEWVGDAGFARGQLFWNEFRGFIETRIISAPNEPPLYEYANLDDGYTAGVELESGTTLGALRADVGASLLATRDRSTGQPLLGRAPHSARLTLSRPLVAGVRASMTGAFTGRTPMQRDSAGQVTSWRDAWPRLDLRLARPVGRDLELSLTVDNVLDRRPAEWAGFTGRQVFAALRWNEAR